MSQIQGGETFTDVAPGKTVTSGRLNNHVGGAVLLNGAVIDQTEKTATVDDDTVLLGDSTLANSGIPKKTRVKNLLTEGGRLSVPQYVASDTGAANAYAIAMTITLTAYTAGQVLRFKAANANTGASTINVDGLGAKNIVTRDGGALTANAILANQIVEVTYDGTSFQLTTPAAQQDYAADGGAANAYIVTLHPFPAGYTAGQTIRFKAANANTGASTVNVNGLGTKAIVRPSGAALVANDIVASQVVTCTYDGTSFQMVQATGWNYTSAGTDAIPAASSKKDFAHGLGVVPTKVRAVLVQTNASAQQGYVQNTELDVSSIFNSGGGSVPIFALSANSTNVTLSTLSYTNIQVIPYAGGSYTTITAGNWAIKVYAAI